MDSHFHLDRLSKAARLSTKNIPRILDAAEVVPDRRLHLVEAVANFCDPDTFPDERSLSGLPSSISVAIGCHPKHATRSKHFLSTALSDMKKLLQNPRVVAVGEIGLDHSVPDTDWPLQNDLIRRVKPLVKPQHVLVIHCRRIPGDNGVEVHFLLLHLLRGLPRTQKIHLHCFDGNKMIAESWIKEFPESFFGFNRGIKSFDKNQVEALVSMDEQRLLLESDAPYFARKKERFSSPSQLYDVAEMVATHRQSTAKQVLEITKNNALRLYQHQ